MKFEKDRNLPLIFIILYKRDDLDKPKKNFEYLFTLIPYYGLSLLVWYNCEEKVEKRLNEDLLKWSGEADEVIWFGI